MTKSTTPPTANGRFEAVVFDLGGVLIDWNPRYLYRTLFDGDEVAMERFLAEVCTPDWNAQQDGGRTWQEAVEVLSAEFPEHRELIEAYDLRWEESLAGPIHATVDVLAEVRGLGYRLAALSNWSAEKFPIARARYDFLGWFETIVISGEVGICKPDPRIYQHLLQATGFEPSRTLFIDDAPANVQAAAELGMKALLFRDADALRADLARLEVLPARGPGSAAAIRRRPPGR
jgi:2-haloacid dehalogenase